MIGNACAMTKDHPVSCDSKRRAQDAIAEIHAFGPRNYHWVFEADITACLDAWSHYSFR